jgi:hypothetical protein
MPTQGKEAATKEISATVRDDDNIKRLSVHRPESMRDRSEDTLERCDRRR